MNSLHDHIRKHADLRPEAPALTHGEHTLSWQEVWTRMAAAASWWREQGLRRGERVALYLPKRLETVIALLSVMACGGVVVPINPSLKRRQVEHILADCSPLFLLTTSARASGLDAASPTRVVCIDDGDGWWHQLNNAPSSLVPGVVTEDDLAAILYTSGSTGRPKGVALSHRNLEVGAISVSRYLGNSPEDRLLAVLPLSFDYGLSQITTALVSGAQVVLHNYLLPRDVARACERHGITGLAAVPPLWQQLAKVAWPPAAREGLRYWTNSGGAMPGPTLAALRSLFPNARPYLMYGLTEAFRSTYLPPELIEAKPGSMGKAIPNAEVFVVDENGKICPPGVEGELVHRGPLVAKGYWNDAERTRQRFRPWCGPGGLQETVVYSGDRVVADEDGFLYFVGRQDEMIKTSGYRVSPTEVEEVLLEYQGIAEAAVVGAVHEELGEAIVALVVGSVRESGDIETALLAHCRAQLPAYMVPKAIVVVDALPRNPNGKLDRSLLRKQYRHHFSSHGGDH